MEAQYNSKKYIYLENQKPIDEDANKFANLLFTQGVSCEIAVSKLIAKGYTYEESHDFCNDLYSKLVLKNTEEQEPKQFDDEMQKMVIHYFNTGRPSEAAVDIFVNNGYEYEAAHKYCSEIYEYLSSHELVTEKDGSLPNSNTGLLDIIVGIVILCIGVAITVISNGSVVAYGAILIGAFKIIFGMVGK